MKCDLVAIYSSVVLQLGLHITTLVLDLPCDVDDLVGVLVLRRNL